MCLKFRTKPDWRFSKVHALVHSGGGANGAWGVGVLQHLFGELGIEPKFWVGTSVGGLNGALVCMFPVGMEMAALAHTMLVWEKVHPKLIYKHFWPGGDLGDMRGAVCKHSVYNTTPFEKFVRQQLDVAKLRASGRPLYVSVVDLATGELIYVDQNHEDICGGIIGTASYPLFFPPTKFDGRLVSDGGLKEITPLQKAVELGATYIDVISCQPATCNDFDAGGKVTLEVGPRYLEIMSTEINNNDLRYDPITGPKITIRLWQPPEGLGNGLDFSQDKAQRLRKWGFEYAKSMGNVGTRTWTIGGRD